ncbi:PspA/IM30 family protein [Chitinispirillales bacterium ANBcel5]|uniref:PspA/IM30 family protein n=1 Tax=Cellulosispirillum alkaliphilum TaxID=3039283 RepID=UPI002A573916|nr:PspA/IM30 family protein [Chitinispirillales bacterium ANBcel5]
MKEGLSSRVSRIIAGGASKMVSIVENAAPEMVLEEALKEIDSAVYDVRSELGKIIAEKHQANSRINDIQKEHTSLKEKIELAITEGREDLAEAAVSRQIDLEAQIPILDNTIKGLEKEELELEKYVSALSSKKRELKQEYANFKKMKNERNTSSYDTANSGSSSKYLDRTIGKVEGVFDRLLDRESIAFSATSEKQLAELEELARKKRIEERLAMFKKTTTGE